MELSKEAEAVLGPLYSAYLAETRRTGYVMFEGQSIPKDEAYRRGMEALRRGGRSLDVAEAYFNALIKDTPEFGEGFFQAARIAERKGALDRARTLMAEASRLAPDHELYRAEAQRLQG
ncbi:MAG: hypothetical protein DPW22_07360 [Alphaproteobacteria bacterium]|nr:hypothetical protein [Alphaproteobacteria bacterium]